MLHEIKIIIDTTNNVIKAKVNNDLICSVWVYSDETKTACLTAAKEACFNEMCKLSVDGDLFTVSENWF
jgi:hypothetical protein